ncbi:hypothetical protein J6590_093545 [Homalodisca vitripennis]|nr:hypothetical protein J6590_093545 [Homalodisca vitripennis]
MYNNSHVFYNLEQPLHIETSQTYRNFSRTTFTHANFPIFQRPLVSVPSVRSPIECHKLVSNTKLKRAFNALGVGAFLIEFSSGRQREALSRCVEDGTKEMVSDVRLCINELKACVDSVG